MWNNCLSLRPDGSSRPLYCLYDNNLRRLVEAHNGFPIVADAPSGLVDALTEQGENALLSEDKSTVSFLGSIPSTGGEVSGFWPYEVRSYHWHSYLSLVDTRESQERD